MASQFGFRDAVGFWTREIWGPPWDAERRFRLWQHYWSYLTLPPLPPEYTGVDDAVALSAQRAYSSAYRIRIGTAQASARARRGVRLTYRPIGKNLRLLGTAIRANADRGLATWIHPEGPADEIQALSARGQAWNPWIWSRQAAEGPSNGAGCDASEAWALLFRLPEAPVNPEVPAEDARLSLGVGDFSRRHLARVLRLAAATTSGFDPSDTARAELDHAERDMAWPEPGERVLGMHVRRGDAASSGAGAYSSTNSTRRSFPLEQYLEAADRICAARGIRVIYLATESEEEIGLARRLRPAYRFISVAHDRSIYPDRAKSTQFIEDLALERPGLARQLAMSSISDLAFFRRCHAFVGAFNSEFSLLAWLLAVGSNGHLIPYISLSQPARRRSLHPYRALLNLQNNCPLELYHW